MEDPIENIPTIGSYLPDNPPTDFIEAVRQEMKRRQLLWSDAHEWALHKVLYPKIDYGMDLYKDLEPNKDDKK